MRSNGTTERSAIAEVTRSATRLRWFNELPLVVLIAIVYFVLAKPFQATPRLFARRRRNGPEPTFGSGKQKGQ
jgi:hypothetical protein